MVGEGVWWWVAIVQEMCADWLGYHGWKDRNESAIFSPVIFDQVNRTKQF